MGDVTFIVTMRGGEDIRGKTDRKSWNTFCAQLSDAPWAYLYNAENASEHWIHTGCVASTWAKPA